MAAFGTVGVVGVGLIGGSIGLALRRSRAAGRVLGVEPNPDYAARLVGDGIVDEVVALDVLAAQSDLIVLAAPLAAMPSLGVGLARASGLITDVASTKTTVMRWAAAQPFSARFVGSHPLAGSERSGPEAARADLFVDRGVYLCALPETTDEAKRAVAELWTMLGGRPEWLAADAHDRKMARVSHGPHAVAAALCRALDGVPGLERAAGPGFRDTTRVAAGAASLWSDILLDNAVEVSAVLGSVAERLTELSRLLATGDRAAVEAWLAAAQKARERIVG